MRFFLVYIRVVFPPNAQIIHFMYNQNVKQIIKKLVASLTIFSMVFLAYQPIRAQSTDELQSQIDKKQSRIKEIDSLIGNYKSKINEQIAQSTSLENQIALLDNQIKEKQLAIERTQMQIDSLTIEVQMLQNEIEIKGATINRQKTLIAGLIQKISKSDTTTPFEILLSKNSLSDYFLASEELQRLNRDLGQTVSQLKTVKQELEDKKIEEAAKKKEAEEEKRTLDKERFAMEEEKNFKEALVLQTKNNEQEFQRILYELKQQEQGTSADIVKLEEKLKEQLMSADEALARGDTFFSWPSDPYRGITAIFHDPTYPFRNIFAHPGIDTRMPAGTAVKAAAGGYVAWTKTGRSYGNYMMIIHANGLATVYAHLSKFIAKPDTFVARGDTIGLSGGVPGMQGAGLSTGAHLHFEVRSDGIPVNPEKYLPQVPDSYYLYYDEYKALGLKL
jgi:murein DD-endopeptidase MepM/ murein hydrolase activator NlpD